MHPRDWLDTMVGNIERTLDQATTRWEVPGCSTVRELGSGAAGTVVLARHHATGRQVAIKYLADHLFDDAEFRTQFRREAQLLGAVDAPTVVQLYEYVESAAGAAIVMELVDGVSLRTVLDQQGPTAPEPALVVLKGALCGLGAAHAAGVVHRDVKPANVLVTADGISKLTDFGIAARAGGGALVGSGTPWYMAPEQWAGAPARPAGDIYAATATFFECLAGEPPFPATDPAALRRLHEHAPVPLGAVPDAVRGLVSRGMAKDADRRPRTVAEFLDELEAAALSGYGADWEERGRRGLAKRVALLALLFPLAGGGSAGGTAIATTVLGRRRRNGRIAVGAAAAALLLIGGSGLAGLLAEPAATLPGPTPSQLPAAGLIEVPAAAPAQVQPQIVVPAPAAVVERPARRPAVAIDRPAEQPPWQDEQQPSDDVSDEPRRDDAQDRGGSGDEAIPSEGDEEPGGGGGVPSGGGGDIPAGGGGDIPSGGGGDIPSGGGGDIPSGGGGDIPSGGGDVPSGGGGDVPSGGGGDVPSGGGGDVPSGGGDIPSGGSGDVPGDTPTDDGNPDVPVYDPGNDVEYGGCTGCSSGDGPVVN
ncbi:protein kinase domain-containing protein [Pseudonocardia sp. CA-107938]|uniref:serine/threonine-protein kinase n=1 Tax=Pseudonocardia sp. CA-107938 TaxID=3240021 RepID=UPI003D942896